MTVFRQRAAATPRNATLDLFKPVHVMVVPLELERLTWALRLQLAISLGVGDCNRNLGCTAHDGSCGSGRAALISMTFNPSRLKKSASAL
jgi:hypothetical protein